MHQWNSLFFKSTRTEQHSYPWFGQNRGTSVVSTITCKESMSGKYQIRLKEMIWVKQQNHFTLNCTFPHMIMIWMVWLVYGDFLDVCWSLCFRNVTTGLCNSATSVSYLTGLMLGLSKGRLSVSHRLYCTISPSLETDITGGSSASE